MSTLLTYLSVPATAETPETPPAAEGGSAVPVDIRGKQVEYFGKKGRALFTGGVVVVRGSSTLIADELETVRGSSEAIARGHVVFKDEERKMDLTCNEVRYTHGMRRIHAKGACQLLVGEEDEVTVVTADEMEMLVDEREAIATGAVRIVQGGNEAVCDRAHLFNAEGRVVLTGRPVLRRPPHEFVCDEAVTYFKEGRTVLTGSVRGRFHPEGVEDVRRKRPGG